MNNFNEEKKPEFVKPPDGINVVGLQVIKRVRVPVWKNRQKTSQTQEGYRFVFRHRLINNCFVTHECKESFDERSNFIKTLSNMTQGKVVGSREAIIDADSGEVLRYSEGTPRGEIIRIMDDLVGHWFNVSTEVKGNFCKIRENRIYLHPDDAKWGSCRDFFGPTKAPIIPPVAEQEAPLERSTQPRLTGFEKMPDAKETDANYPYLYDVHATQYKEQATHLLANAPGVPVSPDGLRWATKNKVPQLEKYFVPQVIADDDIPF